MAWRGTLKKAVMKQWMPAAARKSSVCCRTVSLCGRLDPPAKGGQGGFLTLSFALTDEISKGRRGQDRERAAGGDFDVSAPAELTYLDAVAPDEN